jgi:TonB family protein
MKMGLIVFAAGLIWAAPRPIAESDQQLCICQFVAPTYPPVARLARMQGSVAIKAMVDATGKTLEIEALRDETMPIGTAQILQRAAMEAIQKWRFCSPSATSKSSKIVITFKFRLSNDATPRAADQWYPTDVSFQLPATVEITTTNATIHAD